MKISKEIADKVKEYETAKKRTNALWNEITEWLVENTSVEVDVEEIGEIFIAEKPTGRKLKADGEYCEQHEFGDSGDSFYGKYYHQIEGSDKYVGYHYSC